MSTPRTEAGRRLLDRLGDLPKLMPYDEEAVAAILAIEAEAAERSAGAAPLDVEALLPYLMHAVNGALTKALVEYAILTEGTDR